MSSFFQQRYLHWILPFCKKSLLCKLNVLQFPITYFLVHDTVNSVVFVISKMCSYSFRWWTGWWQRGWKWGWRWRWWRGWWWGWWWRWQHEKKNVDYCAVFHLHGRIPGSVCLPGRPGSPGILHSRGRLELLKYHSRDHLKLLPMGKGETLRANDEYLRNMYFIKVPMKTF